VHCPGVLETEKLAGQVNAGGCVSLIVTENEQFEVRDAVSVTEQLTVVVPFWNTVPDAGVQTGIPTFGQLSETVGAG
jgi:hypothetical protein